MSAVLGHIHFWLYKKIQLIAEREQIIKKEAQTRLDDLADELYATAIDLYGKPIPPDRQLDRIIDHNNIHGWLNEQVVLTEKRFAFIIENLLSSGETLEGLCQKASTLGKAQGFKGNAKEAFMALNGLFLDGMPCDRVLDPIEVSEEKMVWQITEDVHGNYWQDGSVYYKLRDAWTEGFLEESACQYTHQGNKVTIEHLG